MAILERNLTSGVLYLKLNRPDVLNSFNREMALALIAELETAGADDKVRCIAISGAGKAFCAGQDLAEAIDPEGPGMSRIVREHYNKIILGIRQVEKPVVALVNGVAAGAGANIALSCDICVASSRASFIQAFSKIGLIPDSAGTWFLPRLIGFQKASALMMLGDKIGAEEAEKMGMIYKVLPAETFEEEGKSLCEKIAKMPTKGLVYTKQALNASFQKSVEEQLEVEHDLQQAASQTIDNKEGIAAFLEKRAPHFIGK